MGRSLLLVTTLPWATLVLCSLSCAPRQAVALSYPLCSSGGTTWVTERPTVDPRFPGASLWLFCDRGLNIVGDSVDPCLSKGFTCTQAVNDAICKLLGYDKAFGASMSVPAKPGEVVRSLTGEYCLRRGTYAATLPDNLASLPGEPCVRIDSITCIRAMQRMADSLESIIMEAVTAPASPAATSTGPSNPTAPANASPKEPNESAGGSFQAPPSATGRPSGDRAQNSVELK